MSAAATVPGAFPKRSAPAVPSAVLGMLIFVVTEVMFFMALVSAFLVIKSQMFAAWAPPGELQLPVIATAFNTVVLLMSGILMVLATRAYGNPLTKERGKSLFLQAIILGTFFVAYQGVEWVRLIRYGMTMTSGIFGATFFLLIGSHGLHALAAVIAMGWLFVKMRRGLLKLEDMQAMLVFWLFVVGIWPLLYGLVYLS